MLPLSPSCIAQAFVSSLSQNRLHPTAPFASHRFTVLLCALSSSLLHHYFFFSAFSSFCPSPSCILIQLSWLLTCSGGLAPDLLASDAPGQRDPAQCPRFLAFVRATHSPDTVLPLRCCAPLGKSLNLSEGETCQPQQGRGLIVGVWGLYLPFDRIKQSRSSQLPESCVPGKGICT